MSRRSTTIATLFAYNDFLWSLLACFAVLVAVFVTQVQKKVVVTEAQERPAGAASIYVFWPDSLPADVDTHLLEPSGEHLFFRHQQTPNANLLRDDLGMNGDSTPKNFENVYIRNLTPGEYIINIHAFMAPDDLYPIPVEVELNILGANGGSQIRYTFKLMLEQEGEEVTAFRFVIDQNGRVVPGSLNHMPVPFIFEK